MSTLKEEIDAILLDGTMSRQEKLSRLTKIVTSQEAHALLGPEQEGTIVLKKKPHTHDGGMRILNLSIDYVYFNEIIQGIKKEEYRDLNDYYEENGKRYLIPYDTICFYSGSDEWRQSVTVALTDIVCEGGFLNFHLGEILRKSNG